MQVIANKLIVMKKGLLILVFSVIPAAFLSAQVGIGTTSPDSKSILDLSSSSKGLLFPRLSGVQMNGIATPPAGLTVYNTDTGCLCTYNGSA